MPARRPVGPPRQLAVGVQIPSQPIDYVDQKQTGHGGEAAHPPRIGAGNHAPHLEQPIVAGRVNIGGRVPGNLGERATEQGPGIALITPQAGIIQMIKPQPRRQQQDQHQQPLFQPVE
ncbi:MAG: hypothetical protein R3E79_31530 [Caldilineaceae bacterium]